MKTHPATAQIIYAKNELELSDEDIALQLDIDLSIVRAVIAKEEGLKEVIARGIETGEDIEEILKSLALTSENDKVRLEALKYLHAERKGRNDIAEKTLELKRQKLALEAVNVGVNLSKFNEALRRSREINNTISLPSLVSKPVPEPAIGG